MDEPRRNIFCAFYPFCLDIHVRYGKRRFACVNCKRYKPLHFTAAEIIEEAVKCGEFLHELFFGTDPYEGYKMRKQFSDDEMLQVPVWVLRGIMSSFTQGMHHFAGTSNLIQKINDILKQGKPHGQQFSDASGNTNDGGPRTEDL